MAEVYSGSDIVLSIDGRRLTGFENLENFLEFEPKIERVTTQEGMDGQFVFNVNNNSAGTLTIKLLAAHDDNNFCADLMAALALGSAGLPYLIHVAKTGGSLVLNGLFMVQGPPSGTFGNMVEARTWKFVSGSVQYYPGSVGSLQ